MPAIMLRLDVFSPPGSAVNRSWIYAKHVPLEYLLFTDCVQLQIMPNVLDKSLQEVGGREKDRQRERERETEREGERERDYFHH